jgi:ABC-type lipoprotein release transport system permease subunit
MAANTIRQKFIFGSFAILCIFLCITGTFWVRMDNRRSDIGIMCSMGASRSRVVLQYVTEAIILLTLAFVAGLPFILHYVYINGFAEPSVCALPRGFVPNPEYRVNNFYIHFALVTAITYAALMLVTVLSTLIPVLRATHIQPADALREE